MPKQLQLKRFLASLAALTLLFLPLSGRASSVGAPVPKPNGPSQVPASIALPAGGFAWTPVTLPYGTNGSQMAVGGVVDTGSRLSVSPSGAAESGLVVNMPNGTTASGLIVNGGDLSIKNLNHPADLSIAGYPDTYQYSTFLLLDSTGGAPFNNPYWYFSYKSAAAYGREFQMGYYSGAAFGNSYSSPLSLSTTGNLNIQGVFTGPSASLTTTSPYSSPLFLKIASGQAADAEQLQTSTGTVLSHTTAAGKQYAQGFGVRSGTTDTPGFTGTIPPTNTGIHVSGGIVVGYSDSTGATVGN